MNTYSPLRYDAGLHGVVVTVADPNAPALLARERGWLFAALIDEIRRAHYELPSLVLPNEVDFFPFIFQHVTADEVRAALLATNVRSSDGTYTPLLEEADEIDFSDIAARSFMGRHE